MATAKPKITAAYCISPRLSAARPNSTRKEIATALYYPEPLHLQPCFAALGHRPGDFPVAEQACQDCLALPMYPELTDDQSAFVADSVRRFFA